MLQARKTPALQLQERSLPLLQSRGIMRKLCIHAQVMGITTSAYEPHRLGERGS